MSVVFVVVVVVVVVTCRVVNAPHLSGSRCAGPVVLGCIGSAHHLSTGGEVTGNDNNDDNDDNDNDDKVDDDNYDNHNDGDDDDDRLKKLVLQDAANVFFRYQSS